MNRSAPIRWICRGEIPLQAALTSQEKLYQPPSRKLALTDHFLWLFCCLKLQVPTFPVLPAGGCIMTPFPKPPQRNVSGGSVSPPTTALEMWFPRHLWNSQQAQVASTIFFSPQVWPLQAPHLSWMVLPVFCKLENSMEKRQKETESPKIQELKNPRLHIPL